MPNRILDKSLLHKKYNRLTPICPARMVGWWYFDCDCKRICIKELYRVKSGHTRSCGCLHKEIIAKIKTKHGLHRTNGSYSSWNKMKQRCDNPNDKSFKYIGGKGISYICSWKDYINFFNDMGNKPNNTELYRLDKNNNYSKDNCIWKYKPTYINLKGENIRKGNIFEYSSYRHMIKRCSSLEDGGDHLYFLNNIKVCDRWLESFDNFLLDMGKKPDKNYSIHRKNGELGYFKENCVWANKKTQSVERKVVRIIEYRGYKMCLSDWSYMLGVSSSSLSKRLKKMSVEEAFTKPLRNGKLPRSPEEYLKQHNDKIIELYPEINNV